MPGAGAVHVAVAVAHKGEGARRREWRARVERVRAVALERSASRWHCEGRRREREGQERT